MMVSMKNIPFSRIVIMIVDFQHHFTPRELMPKDLGRRKLVSYDENGAPSFIMHWMLFDLDEHIGMMDEAGIDIAVLTSAAGMCADIERSRLCNETAKRAERDYPGRFIGAAHANPLGGADALRGLKSLTIKGDAKFWEPGQSYAAGGEPRFLGDATFAIAWELGKGVARTDWDRDQKYPDPPIRLKYTETLYPSFGVVSDEKGSQPMSRVRVAASFIRSNMLFFSGSFRLPNSV